MSKQDRQGVRTPADIERKYPLGKLAKGENSTAKLEMQMQNLISTVSTYTNIVNRYSEDIKMNIQTFFGKGEPTLLNAPAVNWSDEEKAEHIGDMYCNEDTGIVYLFRYTDSQYEWLKVAAETEPSTKPTIYYVVFYVNGVVVATYNIREGDAVNPPISEAVWVDANGDTAIFPYTPTGDMNFYSQVSTL